MIVTKKKWEELNHTIEELSNVVNVLQNNEISKLRKESKELHDTKELLKALYGQLGVKKVQYCVDTDKGIDMIKIDFVVDSVTLTFLQGEQTTKSDFLKAANMLHLIKLNDQMTIAEEIVKAKERSKND